MDRKREREREHTEHPVLFEFAEITMPMHIVNDTECVIFPIQCLTVSKQHHWLSSSACAHSGTMQKQANDFHWISTNGHWTCRIHSALNPHLNNATVLHCHSVHNVQNVNKLLSFLFSSSPFLSRSSSFKVLFCSFTFQECFSFEFVPTFYFYLWLHKIHYINWN